ncbi:MAG: hypothetical protein KDD47_11600 [Acidobacteria bacterium]|nr:hypothetical protein [Acidobacteriota bacterium]
MVTAAIVLATQILAATSPPNVLVVDPGKDQSEACRAAPEGWDPGLEEVRIPPSFAEMDVERYLRGMSALFTSFLQSTWEGRMRFCSESEEAAVLGTVAELAVRPPEGWAVGYDGKLPSGTEELLRDLASPVLLEQLEKTSANTADEQSRRQQALECVRAEIRSTEAREP